jgi:hypothetical protein
MGMGAIRQRDSSRQGRLVDCGYLYTMALNLKNTDVERLAAEVANLAHETKTDAIRRALGGTPGSTSGPGRKARRSKVPAGVPGARCVADDTYQRVGAGAQPRRRRPDFGLWVGRLLSHGSGQLRDCCHSSERARRPGIVTQPRGKHHGGFEQSRDSDHHHFGAIDSLDQPFVPGDSIQRGPSGRRRNRLPPVWTGRVPRCLSCSD